MAEKDPVDMTKPVLVCLERLTPKQSNQCTSYHTEFGPVVKCPGCTLFYLSADKCAEHLLQECLQVRCSQIENTYRPQLIEWIVEYFKLHKRTKYSLSYRNSISGIYNVRVILEDCGSSPKRARLESCPTPVQNRLEVKIPGIPFNMKCPVCRGYFHSAEACFDHLFKVCLFVKNAENGVSAQKWLAEFPWSINVEKFANFNDNLVPVSNKRFVCKYCKAEMLDEESLKKHFRLVHYQQNDLECVLCVLCNHHALSCEQLVVHVVICHIKCGCGTKAPNFATLKEHLRICGRKDDAVCPMCNRVKIDSFGSETCFGQHLRNCPPQDKVKLSVDDLYFNCDVCHQNVMKSDSEAHLKRHFKIGDGARHRLRRVFINLNDIKNIIKADEFAKLEKLFSK